MRIGTPAPSLALLVLIALLALTAVFMATGE